jgi:anti-anti-sigma regulatory factor
MAVRTSKLNFENIGIAPPVTPSTVRRATTSTPATGASGPRVSRLDFGDKPKADTTQTFAKGEGAGKLFSGSRLSDTLDWLDMSAFAVGGILSGKGMKAGIQNRILPSNALGITGKGSFIPALAVDILFDPLTYFGGASFLKGGIKVAGRELTEEAGQRFIKIQQDVLAKAAKKDKKFLDSVLKSSGVQTVGELGQKELQQLVKKSTLADDKVALAKIKKEAQDIFLKTAKDDDFAKAAIAVSIPFTGVGKKITEIGKIPAIGKPLVATGKALGAAGKALAAPLRPFAKIMDSTLPEGHKIALVQLMREYRSATQHSKNEVIDLMADFEKQFGSEVVNAARDVYEEAGRDIAAYAKKGFILPATQVDDIIAEAIQKGDLGDEAQEKILEAVDALTAILKKTQEKGDALGLIDQKLTDIGYVHRTKAEKTVIQRIASLAGKPAKLDSAKHRVFQRAINPETGETFLGSQKGGKFTSLDGYFPKKITLDIVDQGKIPKKLEATAKAGAKKVKKIEREIVALDKRKADIESAIDAIKAPPKIIKEGKPVKPKITPETIKNKKRVLNEVHKFITSTPESPIKLVKKPELIKLTPEEQVIHKKLKKELAVVEKELKGTLKQLDPEEAKRLRKLITQKLSLDKQIQTRRLRIRDVVEKTANKVTELQKFIQKGEGIFVDAEGNIFNMMSATQKELTDAGVDTLEDRFIIPLTKKVLEVDQAEITTKFAKKLRNDFGEVINPEAGTGLGARAMNKVDELLPGYVDAFEATGNIAFQNIQLPAAVVDGLKQVVKMTGVDELNYIEKAFIATQNWWKAAALLGVAYHTRNGVSNFFNNALAGVRVASYWHAQKLMFGASDEKFAKVLKKHGIGATLTDAEAEILKRAKELGVVDTGFYGSDIVRTIRQRLTKTGYNPVNFSSRNLLFGTEGALFRGSRWTGQLVEDHARLSHFIDRINKGDTFEDAALSVKKFLFDYSELTEFERRKLKLILPFYTWTRKNLPLQLEQLIKKPGRAAAIHKAQLIFEPENAEEIKENLAPWLQRGHPIILPWKDPSGMPLVIAGEGFLPIFDLNVAANLSKANFADLIDMLTPLIKTPYELQTNKNLFFNKKLDPLTAEGESIYRNLIDVPVVGGGVRDPYWGGVFNTTQAQVIKTAYRPLRDLDKILQLGKTPEEQTSGIGKVTQAIFTQVRPQDLMKNKSFTQYLDEKTRKDLEAQYKRVYKNYLNYENQIDRRNLERYQKLLVKDFGIEMESFADLEVAAIREQIKYTEFQTAVFESMRTGKPIPSNIKNEMIRELAKTYKDRSMTRARNALKRLEKEWREKLD